MSNMPYAVLRCGPEWKVVSAHGRLGHFPDRESATLAATGLCREALAAGHRVELLVQSPVGQLVARDIAAPDAPSR